MDSKRFDRYHRVNEHYSTMRLELASAIKELHGVRNRCFKLAKENEALKRSVLTGEDISDSSKLRLEVENLHGKVAELDEMVQEKDSTLRKVFNSPTFKIGQRIIKVAKQIPGGDKFVSKK